MAPPIPQGYVMRRADDLYEQHEKFVFHYEVVAISDYAFDFEDFRKIGANTILMDIEKSLDNISFDIEMCSHGGTVAENGKVSTLIDYVPHDAWITLRKLKAVRNAGRRKRNRITRKRKRYSRAHHNSRTKTVCPRSSKRL